MPLPMNRIRKDSFRITQVVDSPTDDHRIVIKNDDNNAFDEYEEWNNDLKNRVLRLGSVDSGSKTLKHLTPKTSKTSVTGGPPSNNSWKQLNDELNHIFPNKKPSVEKMMTLRKSSSRTSLYDGETSEDEVYHTVHGAGRKNTMVVSRNLDPFSKITRRQQREMQSELLPQVNELSMSNASSNHSLNHETEVRLVIHINSPEYIYPDTYQDLFAQAMGKHTVVQDVMLLIHFSVLENVLGNYATLCMRLNIGNGIKKLLSFNCCLGLIMF